MYKVKIGDISYTFKTRKDAEAFALYNRPSKAKITKVK